MERDAEALRRKREKIYGWIGTTLLISFLLFLGFLSSGPLTTWADAIRIAAASERFRGHFWEAVRGVPEKGPETYAGTGLAVRILPSESGGTVPQAAAEMASLAVADAVGEALKAGGISQGDAADILSGTTVYVGDDYPMDLRKYAFDLFFRPDSPSDGLTGMDERWAARFLGDFPMRTLAEAAKRSLADLGRDDVKNRYAATLPGFTAAVREKVGRYAFWKAPKENYAAFSEGPWDCLKRSATGGTIPKTAESPADEFADAFAVKIWGKDALAGAKDGKPFPEAFLARVRERFPNTETGTGKTSGWSGEYCQRQFLATAGKKWKIADFSCPKAKGAGVPAVMLADPDAAERELAIALATYPQFGSGWLLRLLPPAVGETAAAGDGRRFCDPAIQAGAKRWHAGDFRWELAGDAKKLSGDALASAKVRTVRSVSAAAWMMDKARIRKADISAMVGGLSGLEIYTDKDMPFADMKGGSYAHAAWSGDGNWKLGITLAPATAAGGAASGSAFSVVDVFTPRAMTHEFGHLLTQARPEAFAKFRAICWGYAGGREASFCGRQSFVSDYATNTAQEDFAETFENFVLNPEVFKDAQKGGKLEAKLKVMESLTEKAK